MSAHDVMEGQTFGQFLAVWFKAPSSSAGLDMDSLKAQINKRRAALGLPPMKPDPTKRKG